MLKSKGYNARKVNIINLEYTIKKVGNNVIYRRGMYKENEVDKFTIVIPNT